jgi:hypothetical protein
MSFTVNVGWIVLLVVNRARDALRMVVLDFRRLQACNQCRQSANIGADPI